MSTRRELIVFKKSFELTDVSIQKTFEQQHEFRKQVILADESLTEDEKSEAIKLSSEDLDYNKVFYNEGIKRICENCQERCLATLYCEHCIRNYLKANFQNWTSGNNDIDNLIQKCQSETLTPNAIVEWIPYHYLQNIKYLTKGGCSEIYTADWIDGCYNEWDYKNQTLKRQFEFRTQAVVLKKLENVESANRSWFEEGKSHLTISNKYAEVVQCYGLTKNPSDGNYMLVMNYLHMNLRNYLQKNHDKLTWKERIQITSEIIYALLSIHQENAIHRDLHSGNILYHQIGQVFRISDLGFCGPADKPLNSVYGNLPYIAPEVISEKETTFASDIYSFGMLMWEISSGNPPFAGYDHDYDLAMNIINGMRPKIVPGTPTKYRELMEQCWDANPKKRPDANHLGNKLYEIKKLYQNESEEQAANSSNVQLTNASSNSMNSLIKHFNSKIYNFEGLPEPRNATEDYHSIQNNLSIPYNNSNEVKRESKRIYSNNSDDDEKEELIVKSKKVKLSNNKVEFQYLQTNYIASDGDDDETYSDTNLHPEDQD